MTTGFNERENSFVQTVTVNKQPYLMHGERQTDGSYIVCCRNNKHIHPMRFRKADNDRWQHDVALQQTDMIALADALSFLFNEKTKCAL